MLKSENNKQYKVFRKISRNKLKQDINYPAQLSNIGLSVQQLEAVLNNSNVDERGLFFLIL